MLFDWFKSEKPNVYLGSLAVVSESKLSNIEQLFTFNHDYLHDHIREKLEEIFTLDSIPDTEYQRKSDIGLDVVIVTLRGGEAFAVNWGTGALPLFWRPKIKLVSRLYNLQSKRTIRTFKVSQSVSWKEFFLKLFSFRGIFRFGSLYDYKDMELLLYQACLELIDKMRKVV